MSELTKDVLDELGAAFPDDELEFLPRAQSGGKALGLPYIEARSVMRRLDAVVGPDNWSFDFDLLSPDGKMVKGRLTVCGVTKCDAGEAATEDEVLKSAVSDALKRCGVHFGIGRYLYYLPRVWAPYDAQKRRFTEPPRLERAAVERALALCGVSKPRAQRPVQPAPQERSVSGARRGESGANGQPTPPAAESAGDAAAALDKARRTYHALLTEHFGKLDDDLRHCVNAVLLGKSAPIALSAKPDVRRYEMVIGKLREHAETCAGGAFCDCLLAAQDMAGQAPAPGTSALRAGL